MAIVANLIARGFEKTLPNCIRSLKQSGIDLLNITLNGAKQRDLIEDTCKEIDLPFKITEFDWHDDFSACRQFNLKQMPLGFEWYFWCDSDDIIEGDLKKAVKEADKQGADIAWFWYHYSFDEFDNVTNMFIRERLIRTKCLTTMEWRGMVHETLVGAEQFKNFTFDGVIIKHRSTDENRATRNEQWLKKALETTDDVRYKMYMAHHLSASGKPAEALKWYLEFANDSGSGDAEKWQALCYAASICRFLGDFQTAIDLAFKAIAVAPLWQDAYIELAIDYHFLNDPQRALHWASEAKKKDKAPDLIFFNPLFALRDLNVYTALSLCQIGQFDAAQQLATEAVKVTPTAEVQDIELKIKECLIRQKTIDGIKALCVNLLGHGEVIKLTKMKEILPWWLQDTGNEYDTIVNNIDKYGFLLDKEKRRKWYAEEAYFDDSAPWCKPDNLRYQWILKRLNELGTNLRVLDVGCGTGILTEQIKNAGHRVLGLEPGKEAAEYHKRREIDCKQVFFEDFETDEHFDVVVMTEFLEHQMNPIEHFSKALRLGDKLLLTVPQIIRGGYNLKSVQDHLRVVTIDDVEQWIATEQGRRPEDIFPIPGVATDFNILAMEISHRFWSKKERFIKLFSAACSEPWCPHTLVPGGSEYALREVSQRFDEKGNLVFVYYEGDYKRVYKGVVYRPLRFYDPTSPCSIFIASRTPQVLLEATAEKKYLWAHDINYADAYNEKLEEIIDGVFLDSEFHKQEWLKAYPWSKKLYITGEGIQTKLFKKLDKKKIKHRFIYASAPNRGLLQLLQMWENIRKAMPDATLQIFYGWEWWDKWGGEAKFPGLKSMIIQLCQQEGVEWKGRVPNEALVEAMKEAEIWFYPCVFPEIFCQVAVECQAANVICFYYPTGALPETIGKRGVVLHTTNPDEIAGIIASTMANKNKVKHLRKVARTWAMKQDWNEVANHMSCIFDADII